MAQAVLYPEQPKQVDVVVENPVVSTVALSKVVDDSHKKNRIQVSNTKKPLFFYLNLAKKEMDVDRFVSHLRFYMLVRGKYLRTPKGHPLYSQRRKIRLPHFHFGSPPMNVRRTSSRRTQRYMKQHNDIELSALGMAIPTLVTIAEILKQNGVAVEKKVLTSTVDSKDENKGRVVQKAKLEIFLEKKTPAVTSSEDAKPTSPAGANSAEAKPKTNAETAEAKSEIKATENETKPKNKAATDVVKKEG